MSFNVTKQTTVNATVTLTGAEIIDLLNKLNMNLNIPENANVTFRVPTGGDYSGMKVDLDDQHPVTVQWTTTDIISK